MSVGGLFAGTDTFLVGIEDQDDGGLRLYLGHRANGLYALVYDEDVQSRVRAAWASGRPITVPMPPPGCLFEDAA